MRTTTLINALGLVLSAVFALPGFAQQPTAAERAALFKATLAGSQAALSQPIRGFPTEN